MCGSFFAFLNIIILSVNICSPSIKSIPFHIDGSGNFDVSIQVNEAENSGTARNSKPAIQRKLITQRFEKFETIHFKNLIKNIFGILVLFFIAFLFSINKRAISWKTVITAFVLQVILAYAVMRVPLIINIIESIGKAFILIMDFSNEGAEFIFGDLVNTNKIGYIFAFQVLPTIIFFSALTSLLFYLGIIQKIVFLFAWVMVKAFKISGAESVVLTGNIFLGQIVSPLLVKEYLPSMNRSEYLMIMISGMATLAGGVMAAYINMMGGDDPALRLLFAKHFIAASAMAAPGAVVVSKLIIPQTEKISNNVQISPQKAGKNLLDAIINGSLQGLKLAVNVAVILLVFISFIALLNYIFAKTGDWTNLNNKIPEITDGNFDKLSMELILGYLFYPIAWFLDVPMQDIPLLGRLLGEKIILTEFISYINLSELKTSGEFISDKSIILATYMLSGFANITSIGIQIGGIGVLAPKKRGMLSELGFKALIGGTITSLISALIISILLKA